MMLVMRLFMRRFGEKSDDPEWVMRHGLTQAQYEQAFDELVGQGYRLTQVNGYFVYGQPSMYYAAIWVRDSGPDLEAQQQGSVSAEYQPAFGGLESQADATRVSRYA